ncbi:hypothetical protein DPEC_G00195030 [Dallia pectoralis]|uniref:Uncharacterized protein n=1 Tax=Dallia pectoralis TaxID=75939 RepID=A0ACC2G7J1_DALPE|nr:hypothetical protein DPEC_G00195030 [Dallia pectoralis]
MRFTLAKERDPRGVPVEDPEVVFRAGPSPGCDPANQDAPGQEADTHGAPAVHWLADIAGDNSNEKSSAV